MLFECLNDLIYPAGTIVEMINIGPSEFADDETFEREPFIWATNGSADTPGHWYFRAYDIRPVTRDAREAYADLIALELAYGARQALPSRPLPF